MPIYEYRCQDCGQKSSFLVLNIQAAFEPRCGRCGGTKLSRLMSRFATIRSEESRLESLADPSRLGDIDESDPKSIARWMKRMGKELGEDVGEDFDQIAEEAAEEASKEQSGAEAED